MAQNTTQFRADAIQKRIYGHVENAITQHPGPMGQIQRFGSKDYAAEGESFVTQLVTAYGGSGGFQDANNSVLDVGPASGGRIQIRFPYTYMVSRTTISDMQMKQWTNGGITAAFFDEAARNLVDTTAQTVQLMEALQSATVADGRLGVVTGASAAIAAAATGTVAVDRRQGFPTAVHLEVERSSSLLSNVVLEVRSAFDSGPGTITVTNIGSSSYTPAGDDILYVQNSQGRMFFASWDEAVSTAAYPPSGRGPNTTAVDNPDYKAYVVSAGGGKLTFEMLRAVWDRQLSRALTGGEQPRLQITDQTWTYTTVVMMSYAQRSALRQEFLAQRRFDAASFQTDDPGWGQGLEVIDGIPIFVSPFVPEDKVFLLHVPGWICSINDMRPITVGQVGGLYDKLPGTTNYEAVWTQNVGCYATNRKPQAKIEDVKGLSLTDAGLTVVA